MRITKKDAKVATASKEVLDFISANREDVPFMFKGTFDTEPAICNGVLVGGASKVKSLLKATLTAEEYKVAVG